MAEMAGPRRRNDGYNFYLPPLSESQLSYFPKNKIIQNWNSLHLDIKRESNKKTFCSILKDFYFAQYELDCTRQNCNSCQK